MQIAYASNLFLSRPTILEFCAEHGSDIVVHCANFKKNWANKMVVMAKPYPEDSLAPIGLSRIRFSEICFSKTMHLKVLSEPKEL